MEVLKNQITNKAGFLIYTDYWEKYFSKMTGEQVKEVFKIVFHFNLTFEILTTDDLAVEMVVGAWVVGLVVGLVDGVWVVRLTVGLFICA